MLEIPLVRNSIHIAESASKFLTQNLTNLRRSPRVKLPLAVNFTRILSGVEAPFRRAHLGDQVIEGTLPNCFEEHLSRYLERVKVERSEERVVVKHLLKVRDTPLCINRITMEATTYLIEDASASHGGERFGYSLQSCRIWTNCVRTQKKRQRLGWRKLRSRTEATPLRIIPLKELVHR